MRGNKDHADVKIHPPVLVSMLVLAAFFLNKLFPLPLVFPQMLVWIGYALVLIGLGLAISAAGGFMRARTTLDPHGTVSNIVTSGPYRFSRNPIYLGFVCLLIGFPFIFRIYWGLILSPLLIVLMNLLVIRHEEAYLEKKFGERYTSYKSRVRRWL
jgi:protein-S-isoprenylcysteine O-methyltransferase Ste14